MNKESKEKKQGVLGAKERWSVRRKREVVLRLFRGEPLEAVSREVGVEVYRLEQRPHFHKRRTTTPSFE